MAGDLNSLGRRLLRLTNVAVGLLAAAAVVVFYVFARTVGDESWRETVGALREGNGLGLVALFATVLLVVNLLYTIYGRPPQAPLRYVPSEAPGGVVRISRDALEAGLRAAGEAIDEVTRLRVAIEATSPRRILVRAFFSTPEGVSIQEASRRLRVALSERFGEMVRPVEGARVDFEIEFSGFAGKRARKPPREEERSERPADELPAFRGPQYPIDDEDPFQEKPSS